jgi:peptide chain release factor 1
MLVTDDSAASRNVVVEIRAGTGGDEAALFAMDLYGMYNRYAEKKGWKIEPIDSNLTDLGGAREIVFSVNGNGAWQKLQYESGGHRVQRVPETESQGRIHTSLATVAVLPEAREVDVELDPSDIEMSFMRSSGPGGQHVNKTSSCVRLVHEPTGISVRCQDQKSQGANRRKAMELLRTRIYDMREQERLKKRRAMRKSQIGSGDRNQRIRTYNFPQDRITDHRIGLDVFGIDSFLMGDCDRMFDSLAEHDRAARIQEFMDDPEAELPI